MMKKIMKIPFISIQKYNRKIIENPKKQNQSMITPHKETLSIKACPTATNHHDFLWDHDQRSQSETQKT
jgi:hypothetical protein